MLEVDDSAAAMMERGFPATFIAYQRLPRASGGDTRDLDALNKCNPTCLLAGAAKFARRDMAYFVGLTTPGVTKSRGRSVEFVASTKSKNVNSR